MFSHLSQSDRRVIAAGLSIGLAVLITCALALAPRLAHADVVHLPVDGGVTYNEAGYVCGQEDDATWSWSQCGNHKRGVVTVNGTPRVVGPCAFRRYMQRGILSYGVRMDGRWYPLLERMRGDAWAMAHGCQH